MIVKIIVFFILGILSVIVMSCNADKPLYFEKDNRFFIPPLRQDRYINSNITFRLSERFFVYGYSQNINEFDSISIEMLCNALNDSILITYCYFDFQDVGWYQEYEEGVIRTAEWTSRIVSYLWEYGQPNIIRVKSGENSEEKIVEFNCVLKPEYEKILGRKW